MRDLTKYRLDSAEERLEVAALMIDVGHNKIFAANISEARLIPETIVIMKIFSLRRVNRRVSNINMRSNSARRSESIWRRFKCESTSALRGR